MSKSIILSLVLLLAFCVRFLGMWPGFSDHPDESVITVPAWRMIASLDFSPHYYTYGSFYFYVQALVYLVIGSFFYIQDQLLVYIFRYPAAIFGFDLPTATTQLLAVRYFFSLDYLPNYYGKQLYYAGRLITVLLGSLTVFLTFKIAKQIFNEHVALFSSLVLAVLPLAVRDSKFITVDIPQTFFAMLVILFLIMIIKKGRLTDYVFSGITLGFFFSFKYYPFLFLSLLLAHTLNRNKDHLISKNLITALFLIPAGFLLGSPGAIFEMNIFLKDTVWAIGRYGVGDKSVFTYHPFYFGFLFWKGLTPPISILFLLGVIFGLRKNFQMTFFILLPILVMLYYFSFHTASSYERALQPILPLISILAGLGIYQLISTTKFLKKGEIVFKGVFVSLILLVFLSYPIFIITESGYACTKLSTIKVSEEWIRNNIPENSRVAYVIGTRFPSDKTYNTVAIDLPKAFSLQELYKLGVEYVVLHSGYLSIYESWKDTDFFIHPKSIVDNSYLQLVKNEYLSQSELLAKFEKPEGCWDHKLSIFKLEKQIADGKFEPFFMEEFTQQTTMDNWQTQDFTGEADFHFDLNTDQNYARLSWDKTLYIGPGIVSNYFEVRPDTDYKFTTMVKTNQALSENIRDGVLKMNFYETKNTNPPLYSLGVRAKTRDQWEEVGGIVRSPKNAKFARLEFLILPAENQGHFDIKYVSVEEAY